MVMNTSLTRCTALAHDKSSIFQLERLQSWYTIWEHSETDLPNRTNCYLICHFQYKVSGTLKEREQISFTNDPFYTLKPIAFNIFSILVNSTTRPLTYSQDQWVFRYDWKHLHVESNPVDFFPVATLLSLKSRITYAISMKILLPAKLPFSPIQIQPKVFLHSEIVRLKFLRESVTLRMFWLCCFSR